MELENLKDSARLWLSEKWEDIKYNKAELDVQGGMPIRTVGNLRLLIILLIFLAHMLGMP